jgi:hypothetical protein
MTEITATAEQRKIEGRQRGIRRMKEIAREDAAKRQLLVAELIGELGRPATALDRVALETLAATVIRADRLRMAGRSDLEERRLVVQLQRALGLKPQPVEAKPDPLRAIQDHIDRQRAAAHAVQSVATLTEQPATETRMGLASSTEGCP